MTAEPDAESAPCAQSQDGRGEGERESECQQHYTVINL